MRKRVLGGDGDGRRSTILLGLVAAGVGLVLAGLVWSLLLGPGGTVAVVPVDGVITGETSLEFGATMARAREDPSIDAVVLVANSGGGSAAASEGMYLQTKRTAAEMPVVSAVDAGAASGAYYTVAPSDHIYAKPSSFVGSVGVLAELPPNLEPNDLIATTGPNKLGGADERAFRYQLEALQAAFVGAVFEQRAESLTISREQLGRARTYVGLESVEVGLADEIGDREAAIRKAARLAGVDTASVEVLRPNATAEFVARNNYLASSASDKQTVAAEHLLGNDSAGQFLMVPRSYVAPALTDHSVVDADTDPLGARNGTERGASGR
jgi:protease-4